VTLADGVVSGDVRALARAVSIVEDGEPQAEELLKALYPKAGSSLVRAPASRRWWIG
jgi:LAO/AO transport system kinase